MSINSERAAILTATAGVVFLLLVVSGTATAHQLLAMHDMMPMPPQGQAPMPMPPQGQAPMPMPSEHQAPMPMPPQGAAPMPMPAQGKAPMPMPPQGAAPMPAQGKAPAQPQVHGGGSGVPTTGAAMEDHLSTMNDQMRMRGAMPGTTTGPSTVDLTDRFAGRLAFMKAEIQITEAQTPAWNGFADALRTSRGHLIEARQKLNQTYVTTADRLEQYERHLAARLDAVKTARAAFTQLYATLGESQKRTAEELVAPLISTF